MLDSVQLNLSGFLLFLQVSNIIAGRDMVVDPADFIRSTDRSLSFLPWAHSYGQVCLLRGKLLSKMH